ncbi:MAG: sphinganine-1-phosphate aldolase, partial [Bradymonadia bacterium]
KEAHNLYFAENGLNPIAFKSLKRMESEVVRMACTLMSGDAKSCGTMTSGGTESILLAIKSYRDRARKKKPWILRPEIVLPATIHVAFGKACHYFGIKARYVPVGPDHRADVKAMAKAINRNTIMIAGSAPQYPHGLIDPIKEIAELALSRKIPMHVDACVGGYILPWIEKLGYPIPAWDFRLPGVTSISADLHKYGFAPKGASTLLWRNTSYLRYQFYVYTDWCGGIYASPGIPGSKPGGCIAAAWASMQAMGEDGYMSRADDAMKVAKAIQVGIADIPGLAIVGEPDATCVAYESTEEGVDVYAVADLLEKKGWGVDRQQNPNCIHCTCNGNQVEVVQSYLDDVRACVEQVRANPGLAAEGNAAMYGMMAKVPVRLLVKQAVVKIMEGMYGPDGEVPDLSKVGEGEDDGFVLKAINKYGDQAMAVYSKMNGLRDRAKDFLPF